MHSHDPQARPADQSRKKIRKGTRSCWQCKHRKVRCNFASDNDQSCRECLVRGFPCRSQELPEQNPRESDRTYLNGRMARVESLLEKLLIRVDGGSNQPRDSKSLIDTVETSPESSPPTVTPAPDTAPVFSLFNQGLGFQRSDVTPDFTPYGTINRDWGRLRRDLIALIPSEKTLKIISEASCSWWLMRVQLFEDYDESLLSSSNDLSASHPAVVGKAILWIALCLQQLPSESDLPSLGPPCLPLALIEECMARVSTFVCSDDSIVSCIDGLECLVLQGLIFSNDGKLRSAWLSYRRAADIAQIIGFHRAEPAPNKSAGFQHRATFIWRHILMVDRHFSLILGVYGAISNTAIDLYQSNPSDSQDLPVHNQSVLNPLARIAGSIIGRNQIFTEITSAMLQMTQLHYRLWYYQLMAWVHTPLLRASCTDHSYDYNRQTCLNACRHIITCYINIRRATEKGFDSKILDF
ncbi:unnamed protein product [Penicillium glandicola]